MGLTVEERLKALVEKEIIWTINCNIIEKYKMEDRRVMYYKENGLWKPLRESCRLLAPELEFGIVDRKYPLTCREAMESAFNDNKIVRSNYHNSCKYHFNINKALCYESGTEAELSEYEQKAFWKVVE